MKLMKYDTIRKAIHHGDLLLFRRGDSIVSRLIARAGRGEHYHAAKAAWWNDLLMCLEVREWYGGRAVTLASQVDRYPGRIDVYRPNWNRCFAYDPWESVDMMVRLCGTEYGWTNVLASAMTHLPGARLFVRPVLDDNAQPERPPFCSQAVVLAERWAGVDPVPNLADHFTEPADLARSPFYKYQFTLTN